MLTVERTTISLTYTVVYINAPAKTGASLLQQLMDMMGKENGDCDFMAKLAKKPDGARHKATIAKLEAGIAQHRKVADVLARLTGEEKIA